MKLKDLFILDTDLEQRKMKLQNEIRELQKILEEQKQLQMILQYALEKPLTCRHYFSPSLPHKVVLLLSEIASVEEEIFCLEEKVRKFRSNLYHEKKQTEELISHKQYQQKHHHYSSSRSFETRSDPGNLKQSPLREEKICPWRPYSDTRGYNLRSLSVGDEGSRGSRNEKGSESSVENPNHLSEELMKCLISIFLAVNKAPSRTDPESSVTLPKLALSCMRSRRIISKSPFNSKTSTSLSDDARRLVDPFGVIGHYKSYIQLDRNSLDFSHMPHCISYLDKLRVLINKLCAVDLRLLTHKQKLAFWINIHNACIMNAFLQYGLPPTPEELLSVMNKAALNVDGMVLNALVIENFILRQTSEFNNEGFMDEKVFLRNVYGLVYPEPNVIFALCHGTGSSPAVRVYTAENVMSELEMAKAEYLQVSIAVTVKKKIVLPKLLLWYMPDFADGLSSLLEWIYSQLPRNAPYRKTIMEILEQEREWPVQKMVYVRPYESGFRYIFAL